MGSLAPILGTNAGDHPMSILDQEMIPLSISSKPNVPILLQMSPFVRVSIIRRSFSLLVEDLRRTDLLEPQTGQRSLILSGVPLDLKKMTG
jgi:hypothetical protein